MSVSDHRESPEHLLHRWGSIFDRVQGGILQRGAALVAGCSELDAALKARVGVLPEDTFQKRIGRAIEQHLIHNDEDVRRARLQRNDITHLGQIPSADRTLQALASLATAHFDVASSEGHYAARLRARFEGRSTTTAESGQFTFGFDAASFTIVRAASNNIDPLVRGIALVVSAALADRALEEISHARLKPAELETFSKSKLMEQLRYAETSSWLPSGTVTTIVSEAVHSRHGFAHDASPSEDVRAAHVVAMLAVASQLHSTVESGDRESHWSSQRPGLCLGCGQRFVESARRKPAVGKKWIGVAAELGKEGVCPQCYHLLILRDGHEEPWSADDWASYWRPRIVGARMSLDVVAIMPQLTDQPALVLEAQARLDELRTAEAAINRKREAEQARLEREKLASEEAERAKLLDAERSETAWRTIGSFFGGGAVAAYLYPSVMVAVDGSIGKSNLATLVLTWDPVMTGPFGRRALIGAAVGGAICAVGAYCDRRVGVAGLFVAAVAAPLGGLLGYIVGFIVALVVALVYWLGGKDRGGASDFVMGWSFAGAGILAAVVAYAFVSSAQSKRG